MIVCNFADASMEIPLDVDSVVQRLETAFASGSPRAGRILLYFTPLTLLVFLVLPNGYLIDIATSFMLKNRLHATPEQVAHFRIVTAIPVYFSFAFGLARDLWNPFGMRDRGLLVIFGTTTCVLFLGMMAVPLTYDALLVSILLVMFSFSFVAAAARGLLATNCTCRMRSMRTSKASSSRPTFPPACSTGTSASGCP